MFPSKSHLTLGKKSFLVHHESFLLSKWKLKPKDSSSFCFLFTCDSIFTEGGTSPFLVDGPAEVV
jgi:hypothetical protein